MSKEIEIDADFLKSVFSGGSLKNSKGKGVEVCTFDIIPRSDYDRYSIAGTAFSTIFVDTGGATLSLTQISQTFNHGTRGGGTITANTESIKGGIVAVFFDPQNNTIVMRGKDSFLSDYTTHYAYKKVPVEKATISIDDLVLAQSKPAKPGSKVDSPSGNKVGAGKGSEREWSI